MSDLLRDTTVGIIEAATKADGQGAEVGWSPPTWEALCEAGLPLIGLPEEQGGAGGSWTDAATVVRASGGVAVPTALAEMLFGAVPALSLLGVGVASDAVAAGPIVSTGYCESTGANPIRASQTDTGWRLQGTAHRVPYARSATQIVVLAQIDRDQGLVALGERAAAHVGPGQNVAGEWRDQVVVDGVEIASDFGAVVSLTQLRRLVELAALSRALQLVGAMEVSLQLTTAYARERVQFGRPIARFQAVAQLVSTFAAEVALASATVDEAVRSLDGPRHSIAIAAAKARASEAAGIAARIAHQVHGALGFTQEHRLHGFTRRLWSWRDECGAETYWQRELGRSALGVGADAIWPMLCGVSVEATNR